MKIYPTITTLTNYSEKLEEINSLNIKEACLFLTGLNKEKRKELYPKLLKSSLEYIPFCHVRTDMDCNELTFLEKNFKTKIFNIHTEKEYPLEYDYSKFKNKIYIENTRYELSEKEIQQWAGVCLDFSHLENDRLTNMKKYEHDLQLIEKYPIKCNHISSIKKEKGRDMFGIERYDNHFYHNLSEFDYLKKYDKKLFSNFCAIELENPIKDQLLVIEYINNLLNETE